ARATASAYDDAAAGAATPPRGAAPFTTAGDARRPICSQSGRSVATMNKIPRQTVTVWAKTNHKRCIDPTGTKNEPAFHPAACRMAREDAADAAHQRLLPQRATGRGHRHHTAYYYRSDRLSGTA